MRSGGFLYGTASSSARGSRSMIDPIYDDLPDDEELAFLKLEREYRDRCESDAFDAKRNEENGYVPSDIYLRYMRQTTAIAQELKLDILEEQSRIPSAENFSLSDYRDFIGQVDYHRTVFQLRQARRAKGFSVRFDNNTKRIITHHLNQVRELILSLEVDEWKKESLLTCLNNLQAEVDKDRSGYDVFAAFVIEAAGVLGAAGER